MSLSARSMNRPRKFPRWEFFYSYNLKTAVKPLKYVTRDSVGPRNLVRENKMANFKESKPTRMEWSGVKGSRIVGLGNLDKIKF